MVHNITVVLPSLLLRRLPADSLWMETFLPEPSFHAFNQLFSVPADLERFLTPISWPPQIPPLPIGPGDSAGSLQPSPTRLQTVLSAQAQLPQDQLMHSQGGAFVAGIGQWPAQQQLGHAHEDALRLLQETAQEEAVSKLEFPRLIALDPTVGMSTEFCIENAPNVWMPNAGNDEGHSVISPGYSDFVYDSPNSGFCNFN